MMGIVQRLDAKLYPDFQHRWDDQLFRERILVQLGDGDLDVLDLGAGAGIVVAMDFRGRARRVCGVDPDPRVVDNPYLDEAVCRVGRARRAFYEKEQVARAAYPTGPSVHSVGPVSPASWNDGHRDALPILRGYIEKVRDLVEEISTMTSRSWIRPSMPWTASLGRIGMRLVWGGMC